MVMSPAMQEAYARSRVADVYETLEMDHPSFETPVRIITGWDVEMVLPLEDGSSATFVPCQVAVTLPGTDADGPTQARVTIDNVSNLLLPFLRQAVQSSEAITVKYRAYAANDLTQPGDVIGDMELWEVELSATTAEGTLKYRELELQAFPLRTYDQQYYPALQDN